jgi:hypothetical protein
MNLKCELIIERDGKEVYRGISKSFLKNFGIVLAGMLKNSGDGSTDKTVTVTDTTGASGNVTVEAYYGPFKVMSMGADDNDDSYGIIVGSGSDPVSPSDYALASKISHGTGSGQLDYDTHSVLASYGDSSSYVELYRSFVNKSGRDVVVREVGIAACSGVKYLIVRDVLPSPITVKPLGSLTVRYRISLALT